MRDEIQTEITSRIKTVIFDCGRVMTLDQDDTKVATMAKLFNASIEDFSRVYHAERSGYDRGTLPVAEYWRMVGRHFGIHPDTDMVAQLIELDMDSWFRINPETVAIVRKLKRLGYRILMLSNMNLEGKMRLFGSARILDGEDWLALFDEVLLSCDLGMIKPDEDIYRACLTKTLAQASECLFIDDIGINLEGASRCGIITHLFTKAEILDLALGKLFTEKWRLQ
jgi:putative hydrolase of the HAD superfamily